MDIITLLIVLAVVGGVATGVWYFYRTVVGEQDGMSLRGERAQHARPVILRRRPVNFVNRVAELRQIEDALKPRRQLPFRKAEKRQRAVLLCGMGGVGKTDLAIEVAYRLLNHFPDGVVWQFVGQSSVDDILNFVAAAFDIRVGGLMLHQKKIAIQKVLTDKRVLLIFDNVEQREPTFKGSAIRIDGTLEEMRQGRTHLINLRQILTTRFDEGELRTLCFDLDIDYENLPGEGKADKARELIVHLERRASIPELVRIGQRLRPDISWDDMVGGTTEVLPERASSVSQSASSARLLSEVLDVVGTCAVIITSRSAFRLPGVRRIDVTELPLEGAVELFARTVGRDLGATERKLAEDICERVGRLPLAVALTSSQAELLRIDLNHLLQRIDQEMLNVLRLKVDGSGSVRAVFQSTYETLSPEDKRVFTSLGVFSEQGFSLGAAQAVSASPQIEDRLMRLIALSLVKPLGSGRYVLHPLLKLFAQERLEGPEAYHRMADYYLNLTRRCQQDFDLLELENPNILVALDWAQQAGEWHLVTGLVETLLSSNAYHGFLAQRGYWEQGVELIQGALVAAGQLDDLAFEARFSADLGLLYYLQGRNEEAHSCYQTALAKFEILGDTRGVIQITHRLGYIEDDEDNYGKARELYERSLTLSQELSEPDLISLSRHLVGIVAYHEGLYDEARRCLEQSLQEELARGEVSSIARTQRRLAAVARMQGHDAPRAKKGRRFDEARCLLGEVLKVETNQRSRARALRQLGMVAQEEGEFNEAFEYFRQSLEIFERIGNRKGISSVKYNLGSVAFERGDYEQAGRLCRESLEMARELKCRYGEALTLRLLARLAFNKGNQTQARDLRIQAIRVLEAIRSPRAQKFKALLEQWR